MESQVFIILELIFRLTFLQHYVITLKKDMKVFFETNFIQINLKTR